VNRSRNQSRDRRVGREFDVVTMVGGAGKMIRYVNRLTDTSRIVSHGSKRRSFWKRFGKPKDGCRGRDFLRIFLELRSMARFSVPA
jgi:hypothetical protein